MWIYEDSSVFEFQFIYDYDCIHHFFINVKLLNL